MTFTTFHVDEEDKGVTKCDTLGGTQSLIDIPRRMMYNCNDERSD